MLDTTNTTDVVRAMFDAWTRKNKPAMEDLLADYFHFTSPLDNRLDRAAFLERYWPQSDDIASFDLKRLIPDGHLVLVTYELTMKDGRKFRNTEAITLREAKVKEVEVYFGWDIPHKAPEGGFIEDYHVGGAAEKMDKV